MLDYLYPHEILAGRPPKQYGKAPCEHPECITICSTYTEPQPITGRRLCDTHWCLPVGYAFSASGRVIKERVA